MPEIPESTISRFKKLHELAEKTAKCRFIASRRLGLHKEWSMWTVAIMSILIIALSVLQAMDLGDCSKDKLLTFVNILLSTFILAYSLILSTSDFVLRANKLHQCGMDLNRLRGQLYSEQLKEEDNEKRYKEFNERYADILDKYENHADIDYKVMMVSSKTARAYYQVGICECIWIKIQFYHQYWHYCLLSAGGVGCFVFYLIVLTQRQVVSNG